MNISYTGFRAKRGTRQDLITMASLAEGREPDLNLATTQRTLSCRGVKKPTPCRGFVSSSDPWPRALVASPRQAGQDATGASPSQEYASPQRFALALRQALPGVKSPARWFDRARAD